MYYFFFFFKQKTAYDMRISDWSSDVCSSDLLPDRIVARLVAPRLRKGEEETLVAGQSVDRRRRLAAERAVIGVIGDFQPRQIGDIFAHRQVGVDEGAGRRLIACILGAERSEEHTSELQSLMRLSYAV